MFDIVEFRHLRYIVALAETENFTRAAERLFLAQPSLSQQVKDLEDKLGFPIFLRTRQGVRLTPAGKLIVVFAKQALSGRATAFELATAIHNGTVPALRVGFSSFVHPSVIEKLQSEHEDSFAGCPLQMASGSPAALLHRLENGHLDCALLPLPVEATTMQTVLLRTAPFVVCMRADDPLSTKSEVHLSDIEERLTIHPDPSIHPAAHQRLTELFEEAGTVLKIVCSAETPYDAQSMVRNGLGLALVEEGFPMGDDLTSKPMRDVSWTADTALVYLRGAQHAALDSLTNSLAEWNGNRGNRGKKANTRVPAVQLKLLA